MGRETLATVTSLRPANPDYAQRVRDSFGRQSFMALIGATVDDVQPGNCVLRVPHTANLDQHRDHLHGGVIASLADHRRRVRGIFFGAEGCIDPYG